MEVELNDITLFEKDICWQGLYLFDHKPNQIFNDLQTDDLHCSYN